MRRRKRKNSDKQLLTYDRYVVNGMLKRVVVDDQNHSIIEDRNTTVFDYREIMDDNNYKNIMNNYRGKWSRVFGNDNPIYIELGSGRGKFITEMATQYPDINFIALEVKEEVLIRAVEKAYNKNLNNIKFIWGEVELLDTYFEDQELSRIYINFCDPWHKNRYYKRRLTYRKFLDLYRKKLNNDSIEIHFKTDNEALFSFSIDEFLDNGWSLKNISMDLANSSMKNNITTEYEEKFMELKMPIYRVEAFYSIIDE